MRAGIWIIGIYATWIHTDRVAKNQLNRCGKSLGPYQALVDISEAIHEELGQSLSAYSDKEIEKELKGRPPTSSKRQGKSILMERISGIWVYRRLMEIESFI